MKTTAITGRAETPALDGKRHAGFSGLKHDFGLAAEGIDRGLSDAEIAGLPLRFIAQIRRGYRPVGACPACWEA